MLQTEGQALRSEAAFRGGRGTGGTIRAARSHAGAEGGLLRGSELPTTANHDASCLELPTTGLGGAWRVPASEIRFAASAPRRRTSCTCLVWTSLADCFFSSNVHDRPRASLISSGVQARNSRRCSVEHRTWCSVSSRDLEPREGAACKCCWSRSHTRALSSDSAWEPGSLAGMAEVGREARPQCGAVSMAPSVLPSKG